jgi:hypothetical protein
MQGTAVLVAGYHAAVQAGLRKEPLGAVARPVPVPVPVLSLLEQQQSDLPGLGDQLGQQVNGGAVFQVQGGDGQDVHVFLQ